MQHQRYLELYGADPASGHSFEELSAHARRLSHDVVDARGQVTALQFSTAVEAPYAAATAGDRQPLDVAAQAALAAARAADTSAQVNHRGAADIAGNAREEVAQIEAVPDPDSPEGQAAILAIISQHQAKASETVTQSAAAEQAAGEQAAAGGGTGATPGGHSPAAPSSPDEVIMGSGSGNGSNIRLVDYTTPAPSPTPQIGQFPVPPQVAAAAGPPPAPPQFSPACQAAAAQQQDDVVKKILADMGKGAVLGGLAGVTVDGVGALPGLIAGGAIGGIGGVIDWATSPNQLPSACR